MSSNEVQDGFHGFTKDRHPIQKAGELLITGCPRSGTKSVAQYYYDQGLRIGHECAGIDGTVDWRLAYELDAFFPITIVLVRDPIKTVISLTELLTNVKRDNITYKHIKDLARIGCWEDLLLDGDFTGAAIMWWTSVYDRRFGYPVLRIEDFKSIPHLNSHIKRRLPFTPTIDTKRFFTIASKYGY